MTTEAIVGEDRSDIAVIVGRRHRFGLRFDPTREKPAEKEQNQFTKHGEGDSPREEESRERVHLTPFSQHHVEP